MSLFKLQDLVNSTNGQLIQAGTLSLNGVAHDTRKNLKDKIFFALKGDNFDAHKFLDQAEKLGAAALVISEDYKPDNKTISVIKVPDVLKALQNFSAFHRNNWKGKMVGLTGSNGKTTTKEFISILLSQKHPTLFTQGNLNNHIGVPLTLLELREEHKFAVIEMGMNHAGEITELVKIAKPDVVLVTNVGTAHIEHFGNIEGIAEAKEEIYNFSPPKAIRIYNLDNQYTALMRARAPGGCKVMTYSSHARDVDVSLKEKLFTLDFLEVQGVIDSEPGKAKIPVFGRQQMENAMAAATVALACGLDAPLIWKGLSKFKSSWGRNQILELASGAKILFDAYNANPDSTKMALENFGKLKCHGKKYVVLGDMLELGNLSSKLHFEIGQELSKLNPEAVLLVGEKAFDVERGLKESGFKNNIILSTTYQEKLALDFASMLDNHDIVLVKGSRGMKLEKIISLWQPLGFENK
ncbi:MAG: UDP-N-acetylmuramoyl-tripeptide--D-alanyl-D-alanine ligase [Oligoflexia bacterium]|nr:UDP-N-acetylmuramoyl-tripeptide--D-alanyl-D-alanine ligase [Oligoflexia bacterium]